MILSPGTARAYITPPIRAASLRLPHQVSPLSPTAAGLDPHCRIVTPHRVNLPPIIRSQSYRCRHRKPPPGGGNETQFKRNRCTRPTYSDMVLTSRLARDDEEVGQCRLRLMQGQTAG